MTPLHKSVFVIYIYICEKSFIPQQNLFQIFNCNSPIPLSYKIYYTRILVKNLLNDFFNVLGDCFYMCSILLYNYLLLMYLLMEGEVYD
jgi:hypothetical protein